MKQLSSIFLIVLFFAWMLCFPKETFIGASNGLLLWFQTILPTLLPFMIVSNLLIYTNSVYYISKILKPFIQKTFRVSDQASYAVLVGFLCGYPMGAKVVADFIRAKLISQQEGRYLLSFCNNTSPMFIVSFIVMQNFKDESLLLWTLAILMLTPILCSFIVRRFYKIDSAEQRGYNSDNKKLHFDFSIFDSCIMNGFETITKIGGYIILFSILFTLCAKLPTTWLLPTLEISNGIPWIINSGLNLSFTYPLVLALASFGGFCAVAQTYSMIQETGIPIFPYIIQKLITALVTSLFATAYIQFILR